MHTLQKVLSATTLALLISAGAAGAAPEAQGEAGQHMVFLFDILWWVIFMGAFGGMVLGGYWSRIEPFQEEDRVWRHDGAARFSHWSHAAGCTLLLVSGVGLGFFFLPRQVSGPGGAVQMMDLHFIGALFFVFGGFFWFANTVISPWRFHEHMPDKGSLVEGLTHYAHIFRLTQKNVRPAKYDGSERLAFVPIVLFAALLIFTGFMKTGARCIAIPSSVLSSMTWLHDVSALIMLVLFFFHVLLAAVVPWSWPLLKSMFTGWVTTEFARNHHPRWYEHIQQKHRRDRS